MRLLQTSVLVVLLLGPWPCSAKDYELGKRNFSREDLIAILTRDGVTERRQWEIMWDLESHPDWDTMHKLSRLVWDKAEGLKISQHDLTWGALYILESMLKGSKETPTIEFEGDPERASTDRQKLCDYLMKQFRSGLPANKQTLKQLINDQDKMKAARLLGAAGCSEAIPDILAAVRMLNVDMQHAPTSMYVGALIDLKDKTVEPELRKFAAGSHWSASQARSALDRMARQEENGRHSDVPRAAPFTLRQSSVWSGKLSVHGKVEIPEGVTLTIKPGTEILMDGAWNSSLIVNGTLIAEGTKDRHIVIKAPKMPGYWGGINFSSTSVRSKVLFTELYNGRRGAITCEGASPVIENNIIVNHIMREGGVRLLNGCKAVVKSNRISYEGDGKGQAGVLIFDSEPTVSGNTIINFASGVKVQNSSRLKFWSADYKDNTVKDADTSVKKEKVYVPKPPPGLQKGVVQYKELGEMRMLAISSSPSGRYQASMTSNIAASTYPPVVVQEVRSGREIAKLDCGSLLNVRGWPDNERYALFECFAMRPAGKNAMGSYTQLYSVDLGSGKVVDLNPEVERVFKAYYSALGVKDVSLRLAGYLSGDNVYVLAQKHPWFDLFEVSLKTSKVLRHNLAPLDREDALTARADGNEEYVQRNRSMLGEGGVIAYHYVYAPNGPRLFIEVYGVDKRGSPERLMRKVFTGANALRIQEY